MPATIVATTAAGRKKAAPTAPAQAMNETLCLLRFSKRFQLA
jgi:hypothetical protein